METKEWVMIGGLVLLALFIGRKSNNFLNFGGNNTVSEVADDEESPAEQPTIANGQAYYNLHLSLSGTAYNGLSNEYFPLFGFVGARQIS
jgi:hypothetical protein